MSFRVKTPWHRIVGANFVQEIRDALVGALLEEKKARKLSQSDIARALGVDRSVIHRQLTGRADISPMRVGEIAAILGREIKFSLSDRQVNRTANDIVIARSTISAANSTWMQARSNESIQPSRPLPIQVAN
jgi:transcriptional regulator with XRE-family HTH domain